MDNYRKMIDLPLSIIDDARKKDIERIRVLRARIKAAWIMQDELKDGFRLWKKEKIPMRADRHLNN